MKRYSTHVQDTGQGGFGEPGSSIGILNEILDESVFLDVRQQLSLKVQMNKIHIPYDGCLFHQNDQSQNDLSEILNLIVPMRYNLEW